MNAEPNNCPKCQRPKCPFRRSKPSCAELADGNEYCHGTGDCAPPEPGRCPKCREAFDSYRCFFGDERCHGLGDCATPAPDTCPRCKRTMCFLTQLGKDCSYAPGYKSLCHGGCAPPASGSAAFERSESPPPVAKQKTGASDLTALIEQFMEVRHWAECYGQSDAVAITKESADEIVLALRVLRVLNSNRCVGVRLGDIIRFNIVVNNSEGHYDLDKAERLLGYGGRNDGAE